MKKLSAVFFVFLSFSNVNAADVKNTNISDIGKTMKMEVKGSVIVNADIRNMPISAVLQEIEKKTGVKINLLQSISPERTVTASYKNKEIDRFLNSILSGENYILSFTRKAGNGTPVLTDVGIAGKSLSNKQHVITKELFYGKGAENVGATKGGEGANMGPSSFSSDANGNVYICDTVNKRIQIISPDGTVSSVPLRSQMPQDITIDSNGLIYVYDVDGTLYQHDKAGGEIGMIQIDESRWDSRGPMHIIDDNIYVRGSGRGDVLVAKIKNGKIVSPSEEELKKPMEDGIYGINGRRYISFLTEEQKEGKTEKGGGVTVVEKDGTKSTRFIPVEGVVSVEFIGEDKNENSYIKTEGDRNGELVVEVSKFDKKGNYITTIEIPGRDYNYWSVKTVSVGQDGSIYQMMPGKEKVIINTFLNSNN